MKVGGSHANSSHEASLEPRNKKSERIWVNIVFLLISLKTEIARSVQGPKLQRLRAEDAKAKPYLKLTILVTRSQQITRSSVTIANLETITDLQSWCKIEPINGSKCAKTKNFTRNPEKLAKVPRTREKILKSFTLTIPWNSAKLVKIFLESLHVYTTQIGD